MNIPILGSRVTANRESMTNINKEKKDASFVDEISKPNNLSETDANLDYYNSLCKDYPSITFRLEDIQAAVKLNNCGKEYLGYDGSSHQTGSNYGGIGQCSIEIDVAVIARMRSDKNYEMAVRWMINDSKDRFAEYQKEIPEQPYTVVCIEDNGGKPQRSRMHSSSMPATDEGYRKKMKTYFIDKMEFDPDKMKDKLIDDYLKMIEKSEMKRNRLLS